MRTETPLCYPNLGLRSRLEHLIIVRFLRNYLRFLAAIQLLPALESGEETLVGGQAVLEGVMMRSPHAWAIACRKPSGEVVTMSEPLERPSEKHKWMGWPLVRGVMTLGYAMTLGYRALRFSANVAIEDVMQGDGKDRGEGAVPVAAKRSQGESAKAQRREKAAAISGWLAAFNVILSLAFFIFMYKYIPLLAATELKRMDPALGGRIIFNLVDGGIRLGLFLLFIWGVSLWKDIRRVYEYHGAEHKTVFAFENGDPLETAEVQKYSTFHPRCGTSFLMLLMIVSLLVYPFIPVDTFVAKFVIRIALLPLLVGMCYEMIRFAARRPGSVMKVLTAPGLWLHRITTKPPSDDQAAVAIHALEGAMALEKSQGGELVIA